jgi:CRP/FNR family transcriptional regulator
MKKRLKLDFSLREEPFFRSMSEPVVTRLESLAHHREYEPRQIIYFPDDPSDYVYWVREGRVKVTRVSSDGRELTFRHLFAGDMFGEECLGEKPKRGAYAEAITRTILCLMRARDFRRITREEGEVSLMLAKRLCHRIDELEQVLAETVFKTVRSRVASGLMRLYQRAASHEQGTLTVTHQEIANLVGSTRETTTVVLHGLRRDGILDIANRRVVILDPAALEHAARDS